MKLGTSMTLAGIAVAALGFGATATMGGCSSSDNGPGSSSGPGNVWPGKPSAGATTSTTEHNYAVHHLYLGDTDRNGVASPDAWKNFGYNIDGKISTNGSTDVCKLAKGASKSFQQDGAGGIDNSFGANILPIITTTAGTDAPSKINDTINTGAFTVMIDIVGLTEDAKQSNTGLTGHLFAGGAFNQDPNGTDAKPTWTTADNWPVVPSAVNGGDITKPAISFGDAYINNGTFVNGSPSNVTLSLALAGVTLSVTVHNAILTFQHNGSKADNGMIAGVINTQELISSLKAVAGSISTSLCSDSAFQSIADQISAASDILDDGTNSPEKDCNAISIGLGFTADEIGVPKKVGSAINGENKCLAGDAGTDSGPSDDAGPADTGTGTDTGATDAAHD